MPQLGVNIDHIATLRQARYRTAFWNQEPDPVAFAKHCIHAGASNITAHLREDRRHIQEHDLKLLKRKIQAPINLEMAVTPSMVAYALKLKPQEVCLVPEKRQEVTTEGGLDVLGGFSRIKKATQTLQKKGILVSLFIDPQLTQVKAAARSGAECIELHTGAYANARTASDRKKELHRLKKSFQAAREAGLIVNAGHGLHYRNLGIFLKELPDIQTLNIGHSIISRALLVGIDRAVREIMTLIRLAVDD